MNRHPSFKIFSILFGIVYLICFYTNWTLFRYYPNVRQFTIDDRANMGAPILWYGWLVAAALVSGAVAFAVPRRSAERLWHGWVWIIPAALVLALLVYERRWFV
jgi:hypothetical protein